MEDRIREYEKFIKRASTNPTQELIDYHREMMQNFQQERLIHLVVTLAFVFFSVLMIFLTMWLMNSTNELIVVAPAALATVIMVVLSFFYVKHYYFLENHIQSLYDYSDKMYRTLEENTSSSMVEKVADVIGKIF